MTDKLYLSRILSVTLGVLEALVAQEGQQGLVSHSLGFLVILALQGGLEGRVLTLLWVPETCQDEVTNWLNQVFVTKMTCLCIHGTLTYHESWSSRETWSPCLSLVSLLPFDALLTSHPLRLQCIDMCNTQCECNGTKSACPRANKLTKKKQ